MDNKMFSSNSGDVFCEVAVSHKKGSAEFLKVVAACVVAMVLSFLTMTFVPMFFLLILLYWAGVVFIYRNQKIEYEYIFTSGELDIDKLYGDYGRKKMTSISMENVEVIAPVGSHELDGSAHRSCKEIMVNANDPAQKDYVIVGSIESQPVRILFTPNEKLLDHMFLFSPSKIKKY